MTTTLTSLARLHCEAENNKLCLKGYIRERYHVGERFFARVANGTKRPSAKLLRGIAQAHVRLFPTETAILVIPGHPAIVLGDPNSITTNPAHQ